MPELHHDMVLTKVALFANAKFGSRKNVKHNLRYLFLPDACELPFKEGIDVGPDGPKFRNWLQQL